MLQVPLRYRGYYYDIESGFYYLQSRYYDPEIGRFINADSFVSTGQGFLGYNMFAYCLNNPVCYMDDSGSAAKINLDHTMNVDRAPWREDNPGGGGYVYQSKRRGPSDYGAVEDKFLSILFLKYIFNSDEQAVIKAECFAFYKGKLVVRTNMERSGSFGIIFSQEKKMGTIQQLMSFDMNMDILCS